MDEVDPELLRTFEKLGVPMNERAALAGVAVDVIFDSRVGGDHLQGRSSPKSASSSVRSRKRCASIPELVRKYWAAWCRPATIFTPRSIPRCSPTARSASFPRASSARWNCRPISASTPRISGQFERTLIIAEEGASVSYLEGCTAPKFDTNQLHAAVVELVALDNADIKYSTVQNWYAGDENGVGGIYNFVTKRGLCKGVNSQASRGPRSRPARRSPGNTRAACCSATIRSASSIRWR